MQVFQTLFNAIVAHALTMTEPSFNPKRGMNGQCEYRGPGGNKCFVGGIIADEAIASVLATAHRELEVLNGDSLTMASIVEKSLGLEEPLESHERTFIADLQRIHDAWAIVKIGDASCNGSIRMGRLNSNFGISAPAEGQTFQDWVRQALLTFGKFKGLDTKALQ
jgi:hypothetical protein